MERLVILYLINALQPVCILVQVIDGLEKLLARVSKWLQVPSLLVQGIQGLEERLCFLCDGSFLCVAAKNRFCKTGQLRVYHLQIKENTVF